MTTIYNKYRVSFIGVLKSMIYRQVLQKGRGDWTREFIHNTKVDDENDKIIISHFDVKVELGMNG